MTRSPTPPSHDARRATPQPSRAVRLGTRQSPLAMAQAEETRVRLCAAHGWPPEAVELVPVMASGDRIVDRPLADIGGKALWTKELDLWLADGTIDAAVHSMKDVETLRPDRLTIAAVLPRADVRDVLIGAESLAAIPAGARVGTSAPRRAAQMLHTRPDLTVVSFRGNVATRLGRLDKGEADVTLLAAAGLERLGHTATGTPLDPAVWLPAPAQGAIGIECLAARDDLLALFAAIDHGPSHAAIRAERALLRGLGGTCHSPIAVHTRHENLSLHVSAALFSPDGHDRVAITRKVPLNRPEAATDLARDLLDLASPAIRAYFNGLG